MSPIEDKKPVEEHFDEIAKNYDYWKKKNAYYYAAIKTFIVSVVPPGSRVLEVGCGTGEILASTKPQRGVGIDISSQMTEIAAKKFPQFTFIHSPIEDLNLDEKFDYVIMVDVVDHVYDVMSVFESLYRFCKPTTRIILTTINPWWDPIFAVAEKLGAKMPEGPHNFVEKRNLSKMLELLDFSVSYSGYMLLFPKWIPILSYFANSLGVRMWGIKNFSCVQYMIIQPTPQNQTNLGLGCSVIIPCYNESGNIQEAVRRVPKMGKYTEIIVVNDGSKDDTSERVKSLMGEFPNLKLVEYSPNRGKGQAVRAGFEAATQEIVMILDADMTVPPEELPRFFAPINKGLCQFVNGTRLVYPMQNQAMRLANHFGNKIFGLILTWITQQGLTDTLCGTKALYKKDFQRMKWGSDKWGDFDLLFGAAKIGCKIMEVPVHYKMRKSGESKMKAFQHGMHLLAACFIGLKELIFVPRKDFYRIKNELAHGQLIRKSWKGTLWYWETPAGQIRWKRRKEMLVSSITPGMKVLEIGCGVGYFTKEFVQTKASVVAIDISPELLDVAREHVKSDNIDFRIENGYDLSFEDNSFDLIVGSSVLHHLELDQALKEFYRVLKPGGIICFTEPNFLNPQVFLERKVPVLRKLFGVSPDETAFIRRPLSKKLFAYGFKDIKIFNFDFLHPLTLSWLIPIVKPLGELMEKVPFVKEITGSLYIYAKKNG